jgi:hypothetical protein
LPKRHVTTAILFVLFAAAAVPGCSQRRGAEADNGFTVLYAELMLLNDQERSAPAVSDSAYRRHAADILTAHGTTRADFTMKSNVLMQDDRAWRDFLGRVSLVFDSLKTVRALPPKQQP